MLEYELQGVDVILKYLHQVRVDKPHVDIARPLAQDNLWVINKVFRGLVRGPEEEELAIDLFQRGQILGNHTVETLF